MPRNYSHNDFDRPNRNRQDRTDQDRTGEDNHYHTPFYQGERDEGRPRNRAAARQYGQDQYGSGQYQRDDEHLSNAADTYGARNRSSSPYRPSSDWNGNREYNERHDYDHGRVQSGRSTYGSGRYETDYNNEPCNAGYARRERPEYNRFDQDHDQHGGYSHQCRSWRSGEGLESESGHSELYGSTYGEPDQGRSRFRSANEWHLPSSANSGFDRDRDRSYRARNERAYGSPYDDDEHEDGRLTTGASSGRNSYRRGWRD